MTTSPVMGITEELLAVLEADANASLGENGTGFVERVTGFSVIDLVAEVRRLREALAHNPAPAVPTGWKLVPVESTVEMEDAGCKAASRLMGLGEAGRVYSAMLDAAPATPAAEQPDAWAPSGADYDRNIHRNPDAAAWADLFVATFPGLADKHDLMLGWFANAMMAMHDFLKSEQPDTVAVPRVLLERLAGSPDIDPDCCVAYYRQKLRALLAGGAE